MFTSSEKFSEQFHRVQQQFKELTPFEQLYANVELTNTFQISYRYFLMQLHQANIQNENNIMFNHTVDDANSPGKSKFPYLK
jgi:flagellin-specific chaperone FliS